MGKAANRKRDRKQAASVATTQAIQKAKTGAMDDMLVVMHLMTAIEMNDLTAFESAVQNLKAAGSDLFHFEIKLIEGDDQGTDMSLLHYAIYMGAEDIVAWIIRCGVKAGNEESISEFQGMMGLLNFGGNGTQDLELFQRLCLKVLRPDTEDEAFHVLEQATAAMQAQTHPVTGLTLMLNAALLFLNEHGFSLDYTAYAFGDAATVH